MLSPSRVLVSSIAAALVSPTLVASNHVWVNPADGAFDAPHVWLGGVPGPADVAEFGLRASTVPFFVTVESDIEIGGLIVEDQRPLLDLQAHAFDVGGSIAVGGFSTFHPTLVLSNGLCQASEVKVGDRPGSASLTVDWSILAVDVGEGDVLMATDALADATLTITGFDSPFGVPATLYADNVTVGALGQGSLLVDDSCYVECNGSLILGAAASGDGLLEALQGAKVVANAMRVGEEGRAEMALAGAVAITNDVTLGGTGSSLALSFGAFLASETLTMKSEGENVLSATNSEVLIGDVVIDASGPAIIDLSDSFFYVERSLELMQQFGGPPPELRVRGSGSRVLGEGNITSGLNGQSIVSISDGGLVVVSGSVQFGIGSELQLTIEQDQSAFIECGAFTADGHLSLALAPGVTFGPGQTIPLVTAGKVTGFFGAVSLPPGVVGSVVYHSNEIVLTTTAAQLGDLTGDGVVGAADLSFLLGDWGLHGSPADLNNDGVVSAGDLAILLAEWG
ncbi:MAG: hypothetical protein JNL80_04020 [Phycisphaerae bacterium]|nr:hypothetical protein [Phycisphaerae bacterium]